MTCNSYEEQRAGKAGRVFTQAAPRDALEQPQQSRAELQTDCCRSLCSDLAGRQTERADWVTGFIQG